MTKRKEKRDCFLRDIVCGNNCDISEKNSEDEDEEDEKERWTRINFGDSDMVKEVMSFVTALKR